MGDVGLGDDVGTYTSVVPQNAELCLVFTILLSPHLEASAFSVLSIFSI